MYMSVSMKILSLIQQILNPFVVLFQDIGRQQIYPTCIVLI